MNEAGRSGSTLVSRSLLMLLTRGGQFNSREQLLPAQGAQKQS